MKFILAAFLFAIPTVAQACPLDYPTIEEWDESVALVVPDAKIVYDTGQQRMYTSSTPPFDEKDLIINYENGCVIEHETIEKKPLT